jgi:monoamine oxidase
LDAHVRPSFRGIDGSERTGRLDRVDKLRAPTAPVLGHGVQDGSRSRAGWDIAGVKAHGHAARGDAGLATGATALWSLGRGPLARGANAPRVVVVGAGLAGLTCAYRLQQARVDATVYEAAGRVGGRCWTIYDAFAEGQIAEHGGELIDQGHNRIRNLVQELGLDLENLLKAEANGTEATYFFDGGLYTYAEATDDLKAAWQKIHKDVSAASYPTLFDLSTERGRQLDAMSIVEWIDETFDGGVDSKIGRLLDSPLHDRVRRRGLRAELAQPPLPAGVPGPGPVQRVRALGREVPRARGQRPGAGAARRGTRRPDRDGFRARGAGAERRRDVHPHLPPRLRHDDRRRRQGRPDGAVLDPAPLGRHHGGGLPTAQADGDQRAGHGHDSKLQLQFARRHWRDLGFNGETYADTGYQNTWEVTRGQPGRAGILVDYTGGTIGDSFGSGSLETHSMQFLAQLEPVLPGITEHWNGKASSTTGRAISGRAARTRSGRSASTRSSRASSGCPRATATSPANTRPSTSRAT